MKNLFIALILISFTSCLVDKKKEVKEDTWITLWNGNDFEGWHSYLGQPFQIRTDSLGNNIEPFGIDNDPLGVITIVPTEQGNAIRISGVAWGMIYTEKDYGNYHLKLKMKWGEEKHPPRKDRPRDSGLLYHGYGAPGSANNWMSSQELQIQEGDIGDYWPVGDVEIDIPSVLNDSVYYIYKKDADLRTYYLAKILQTAQDDSMAKRRVLKAFDAEKPHGEWNDVELITYGDSSIHIVNGQVVMRLFNSRTMTTKEPLNFGKIILQSEGAEVYYKDLQLKLIDDIPEEFN
ncbi:MAG: DUF1080 domain-containing protein [Bacteroidales bacterium]|nr:DUF1080 domain-containing protein [Bacteroidales bacterium]